jgi:small subunit ribosomal protein S18
MPRNMSASTKKRREGRRTEPRASAGGRGRNARRKYCLFCAEHAVWVDFKDVNLLRRFINDRGRIRSRAATGTCAQHQRDVAVAIKNAREMLLLPYVVRTASADSRNGRSGGRRGSAPAAATADAGDAASTVEADLSVPADDEGPDGEAMDVGAADA